VCTTPLAWACVAAGVCLGEAAGLERAIVPGEVCMRLQRERECQKRTYVASKSVVHYGRRERCHQFRRLGGMRPAGANRGRGGSAILKVGARERRRHSAARPALTNVGNRNPQLGTAPASPRSGTARFSNAAARRAAGGEGQTGRRETRPTDGLCWAREGGRGHAALELVVA
jgi:hypothetical protein